MTINERTKVGLFTILGVLPFICGVIFWLATVSIKVDIQKEVDTKQDSQINSSLIMLVDIRERLIRLETQADNKKEKR